MVKQKYGRKYKKLYLNGDGVISNKNAIHKLDSKNGVLYLTQFNWEIFYIKWFKLDDFFEFEKKFFKLLKVWERKKKINKIKHLF